MARRLFVSVDLPEALESEIRKLQSSLKSTSADLNHVDTSQVHITLKFLGDTEEERIPEVKEILDNVASNHSEFTAKIQGTGVFPNRDYISVIWLGVDKGESYLREIHEGIEEKVVEKGLAEEEEHDFTPHATLARMNSGKGKYEIHDFLDETQNTEVGEFDPDSINWSETTAFSPDQNLVYLNREDSYPCGT
ncbi:MAG: RNA 2',3'-cyclic phosphodiesterase, partial [Halobacteria archaeon]|nr:RNA 2',3'-cyclic phosphodiesterase [Halobacteria archaeon]